MKPIFEGEVLETLLVQNGIVFAYIAEKTNDGKTVVAYRHINFESGRVTTVTKKIFQLSKFGPDYAALEPNIGHHLTTLCAEMPEGYRFLVETDGIAKVIDINGINWTGTLLYKDEVPCAISYFNNCIWAVFKKYGVIVKFNINSFREELRIGGSRGENGFSLPCGIFIKDEDLYISNEGSMKIWKVNSKTYETQEYAEFEEPVYGYFSTANLELAVLKSGIYVL